MEEEKYFFGGNVPIYPVTKRKRKFLWYVIRTLWYNLRKGLSLPVVSDEQIWESIIINFDDFNNEDSYTDLVDKCRQGIPKNLRGPAWLNLCGAKKLMADQPDLYKSLLQQDIKEEDFEQITKDLYRLYPDHELLPQEKGREELFNILKAFAVHRKDIGYCQDQGIIAAFLLMFMPEEEAFWTFNVICSKYLSESQDGLITLVRNKDIFCKLLNKISPDIHDYLEKLGVDPLLFLTEWFLCVYIRALPWETTMRIWDMFLCEGFIIVFKVALVLVKTVLTKSKLQDFEDEMDVVQQLKTLPPQIVDVDELMNEISKIKIKQDDLVEQNNISNGSADK